VLEACYGWYWAADAMAAAGAEVHLAHPLVAGARAKAGQHKQAETIARSITDLPERAGQPVKVWAHISLADLLRLDGSSALQEEWTAQVRARWAAHRAAASGIGSDGGAWLDGDAAEAIACDAAMAPVVTGDVNVDALADLVRLCVELDARRDGAQDAAWAALEQARHRQGRRPAIRPGRPGVLPAPPAARRPPQRAQPAPGYRVRRDRPAGIRNAVTLRDKHCQWAGRCDQPASAVHHTRHKALGGKTSVKDCVLLCSFHHQVMIHRRGWTLVLNPDGTTTAWNKDKTKVLHSHGPPVRPE
jgi:hypothetical protein